MLRYIFRGHGDAGSFVRAVGLRPGRSPVLILPFNKRTDQARYACFIPVRGLLRMSLNHAEKNNDWHYTKLEPEVLGDVRAGRAVIVFDLSNEGPAYSPVLFSELYSWIAAADLPPGRCIWLQQNRAFAAAAKDHVGARADGVQFQHYDYFVKVIAWMFACENPENALGADPDVLIARQFDVKRKDKLLLCLNATPRLSRVLTVAALHHHQLITESLVSFPGMQYVKQSTSLEEVERFVGENPSLEYLRSSIRAVGQMADLRVDEFSEQGNALVTKIDPTPYERSFFSLVTESDFSDDGIERVTEKTAKAYCMGHPALVIGNAHSVNFMTDLGFQDWDGFLDRSPEKIVKRVPRFEAVIREVLRQAARVREDRESWLDDVRQVGAYNVRHAVGGRFLAQCIEHMDVAVVDRLTGLIGV